MLVLRICIATLQGTASIDEIIRLMYHIRAQSKRASSTATTSSTTTAAAAGTLTAAAAAAALDDAEAAAAERSVQSLLDSTPQAAFPLPRGQYPAFDGYPNFVTNYQVSETNADVRYVTVYTHSVRACLCWQCSVGTHHVHVHACAVICVGMCWTVQCCSVCTHIVWHVYGVVWYVLYSVCAQRERMFVLAVQCVYTPCARGVVRGVCCGVCTVLTSVRHSMHKLSTLLRFT
jgi:hypothetical protein